jgi:DNA-binding transcriptional LysR family regulator
VHFGSPLSSPIAIVEQLQAGSLKALRIEGLDLKRHFYLTRHKHRSLSPPAQAFVTYLAQAAAETDHMSGLPLSQNTY